MSSSSDIERTLGRILATQEYIVEQIKNYDRKLDNHLDDDKELDKRLSKLEHNRSYLLGMVAAISFLIPYLSDVIMTKIGLK